MSLSERKRYKRQEKTKEDKMQLIFSNGQLQRNPSQFAVAQFTLDFTKKVNCPFCLSWLKLTDFVVSAENGYDKENGVCPECGNEIELKNLFHLNKWTPEKYAQFIVEFPAGQFWKKCRFEKWKKHLTMMGWSERFWLAYRRLKPKLVDEGEEAWNNSGLAPKGTKKGKKERKPKFTALECRGCSYRGDGRNPPSFYCLKQCNFNTWTDRTEKW